MKNTELDDYIEYLEEYLERERNILERRITSRIVGLTGCYNRASQLVGINDALLMAMSFASDHRRGGHEDEKEEK